MICVASGPGLGFADFDLLLYRFWRRRSINPLSKLDRRPAPLRPHMRPHTRGSERAQCRETFGDVTLQVGGLG